MTAKLASLGDCILAGAEEAGTIQFECGYLSPYFATDPECMEVAFENAYVLIHEKKVSSKKDLLPLLEHITGCGKPLLIIAEDVEGEALATLVVNKLCGSLRVAAVRAPGVGDQRRKMLQDIAFLIGGSTITECSEIQLANIQISDLGQARKIIIDRKNTMIEGRAKCDQVSIEPEPWAHPSTHASPLQSSRTTATGP